LKGKKKAIQGKSAEVFNTFWDAFDDKRGKADAIDEWSEIEPSKYEHIIYGAKQYANERRDILARNGVPKMAQGWLSARRWEDYPMPKAMSNGSRAISNVQCAMSNGSRAMSNEPKAMSNGSQIEPPRVEAQRVSASQVSVPRVGESKTRELSDEERARALKFAIEEFEKRYGRKPAWCREAASESNGQLAMSN